MNISMQAQRESRGITLIMAHPWLYVGGGGGCGGEIKFNRLICKLLQ
jgi:hypothetical protein